MTKTYGNFTDFIDFTRSSGGTALRRVSYGAELVTNGTFDTDTTGWVTVNGSISSVSGKLYWSAAMVGGAYQTIPTQAGKVYYVTTDLSVGAGNIRFSPRDGSTGGAVVAIENLDDGYSGIAFTALSDTTVFYWQCATSTGGEFYLDNISVKEVTFDDPSGDLVLFNHPDNIPRVEYDANGTVKGLLIEEARTNLVTYSEAFDNSAWAKAQTTVSADDTTAPDGNNTADKLVPSTNALAHQTYEVFNLTSGVTYNFSGFFKAGGYDYVALRFGGAISSEAFFDLASGVVVSNTSSGPATIEDWGNGWYRCALTETSTVTASVALSVNVGITSSSYIAAGDGTSGIYAWGAQLEQGSFPTSYIPTSGATATRSADIASIATSNFGYNPKAGTVVVEFSHIGRNSSTNIGVIYGGATNARWVYSNIVNDDHYTYDGINFITHGSVPVGQVSKLAVAVNSTTQQSSLDGASVVSASHNGNISQNTTAFNLGTNHVSGGVMSGHIKSIKYRPRRNTNTQLQEFTS